MDSRTKRKVQGRLLTLISKINELKLIGRECAEINAALPSMEDLEQKLMFSYMNIESL